MRLTFDLSMTLILFFSTMICMQASGTLNPDFTTGIEGFVPAVPPTGNAWTVTERLIGNNVITQHDLTMFSASLTKTAQMSGKSLLMNNHAYLDEEWTLDSTLRLFLQSMNDGGKASTFSPSAKIGYRVRTSITLESEAGLDFTKNTPSGGFQSSNTLRRFFALGFRWDF